MILKDKSKLGVLLWSLAQIAAPAIQAEVGGRVVTSTGRPVEHARVEISLTEKPIFTDSRGRFEWPTLDAPADLRISHPRFEEHSLRVEAGDATPVEIVLSPKQAVFEEIAVSANRGEEGFAPISVSSTVIDPLATVAPASTVAELVAAAPAVSENGQGGIFQTYSIRGVARLRVLTLISGMRIVGERRAGVSASFLDPLLLGAVDVVRGPSSTFWGSGALGGVIQMFPRREEGTSATVGYSTSGDEAWQSVGWGAGEWSVGVAHRRANGAETPAGGALFSGFEQFSAVAGRAWMVGDYELEAEAIASRGTDIEKASTDFPGRITVYPDENHLLLRFGLRSPQEWGFNAWVHPNDLETSVERVGRELSVAENDALDMGFHLLRHLDLRGVEAARFGIDYFGRRSVDSIEESRDLRSAAAGPPQTTRSLEGATEDELGLFGAVEWNLGKAILNLGTRFSLQQQGNEGSDTVSDQAAAGFVGIVVPLGGGFELAANAGSGIRFPSLSERYFSGTTGRGEILAGVDLQPERSFDLDAGLRWYGESLYLSGSLFRNYIDRFIERVEVEPGVLTYVNLDAGTLRGAEIEGAYQVTSQWQFDFGGHVLEGRDESDQPLGDVPPDRLFAGGRWSGSLWNWRGRWEHRFEKNDPGSGEKAISEVDLISASLGRRLGDHLEFTLSGRNLLDAEYFNAADAKVPLAPGRGLAVSLTWRNG